MTPTLWTIGYEQLWPDALVAELSAAGVQRVLDVRYRPQSRRPGMSKTKLALKLAEHGIVGVRGECGANVNGGWVGVGLKCRGGHIS